MEGKELKKYVSACDGGWTAQPTAPDAVRPLPDQKEVWICCAVPYLKIDNDMNINLRPIYIYNQ